MKASVLQLVDAMAGGDVEQEVETVTLAYTYLGCVSLVAHFLETAMFMWAGGWFSNMACNIIIH